MKRKTNFNYGKRIKKADLLTAESGIRLILGIIKSGIKDKDIEYFNSDTFTWHCDLLGLDVDLVRRESLKVLDI